MNKHTILIGTMLIFGTSLFAFDPTVDLGDNVFNADLDNYVVSTDPRTNTSHRHSFSRFYSPQLNQSFPIEPQELMRNQHLSK